jgi:hypothetical protein
MLLDGVKGTRMPVLKRDIVRGEQLVVDLEPRKEVGDPVYGPDVRMFGWNAPVLHFQSIMLFSIG